MSKQNIQWFTRICMSLASDVVNALSKGCPIVEAPHRPNVKEPTPKAFEMHPPVPGQAMRILVSDERDVEFSVGRLTTRKTIAVRDQKGLAIPGDQFGGHLFFKPKNFLRALQAFWEVMQKQVMVKIPNFKAPVGGEPAIDDSASFATLCVQAFQRDRRLEILVRRGRVNINGVDHVVDLEWRVAK